MESERTLLLDMIVKTVYVVVLHFPVSHYLSAWNLCNRTWHTLVFIKTEDGTVGIGEGTPYWSDEYEDYREALRLSNMINKLPLDKALSLLKAIESEKFKRNERVNYGAFLAVESALLDASSKIYKKPMADLLGGIYRVEVPVAGTVFLRHPLKMAEELKNYIRKGMKHIKFKISPNLNELKILLRTFRETIEQMGEDVVLRADANGCFKDFDKACQAIKLMEKYGVGVVEQPMPRDKLREITKLRRRYYPSIEIMLDESLRKPSDIELFAQIEVADAVNFHPSKLGCLTITRETILKTQELGMKVNIGSALMTDIGLSHYLNLAASIPRIDYPLEEIGLYNFYGYGITKKLPEVINGNIAVYNVNVVDLYSGLMKKFEIERSGFLLESAKRIVSRVLMDISKRGV
jgi:L-alanine-DL-glutamate epimerase-like enolase superfamily enzyme